MEAYRRPRRDPQALAEYATAEALAAVSTAVLNLRLDGVRYVGEPTFRPEVVRVKPGRPPVVVIRDCIGLEGYDSIDVDTGDVLTAPGQPREVPGKAWVSKIGDDHWLVQDVKTFRGRPC